MDVFELPNSPNEKITLDSNVKIQKQGAFEEAEEREPESAEREVSVLRLNEWLGLTEAGLKS